MICIARLNCLEKKKIWSGDELRHVCVYSREKKDLYVRAVTKGMRNTDTDTNHVTRLWQLILVASDVELSDHGREG